MKAPIVFLASLMMLLGARPAAGQLHYDFKSSYTDRRYGIWLAGDYLIASDAVTVKFQNTFIRNGFLDAGIKDDSFDGMKDRSVQASSYRAGIGFLKTREGHPHDFWYADVQHRSHYNTKFTRDLFGLYFYGNKPYAGKTADLSDLNYRSMTWQQAQFGISRRLGTDSSYWEINGAVSLLNGQQYMDFTTGRGTFYTHPDAEYIEMDLFLESHQSDSSDYKFGASNGFGASFDLMATYTKPNDFFVSFGFRDAGFIAWNSSAFQYTVDTLYRFEGALSSGFFDSLFLDISSEADFIHGFQQDYRSGGFTTALPIWTGATYGKYFREGQWLGTVGTDYLIHSDYTVHVKLGAEYRFGPRMVAGTALHYGGYATWGWELSGGFDLSHGMILTVGTPYLGALLAPSSTTAQGAHFGFTKFF